MDYRVLVVDDEPPSRRKILHFLEAEARLEAIGEAGNGTEALALIEQQRPDLVFLDIQMPGMTGLELLAHLSAPLPLIIFTTAYDQYAVQAFELHALDYLLKPFDRERFSKAVARALSSLERAAPSKLAQLVEQLRPTGQRPTRLLLRDGRGLQALRLADVLMVLAEEKYVRLVTRQGSYLHRETMANIESLLDPQLFARINRGTIIHISCFKELQSGVSGDYVVVLKDGSSQTLGRNWRQSFLNWLENAP